MALVQSRACEILLAWGRAAEDGGRGRGRTGCRCRAEVDLPKDRGKGGDVDEAAEDVGEDEGGNVDNHGAEAVRCELRRAPRSGGGVWKRRENRSCHVRLWLKVGWVNG